MKKTNKELLEFFGLKVGNKVKVDGYRYPFVIVEENDIIFAKKENCLSGWDFYDVGALTNILLTRDYGIITSKKKLGEMKCNEILCSKCPLRAINCDSIGRTLYEALEKYREYLNSFDDPLKPFEKTFIASIKAELDKEI